MKSSDFNRVEGLLAHRQSMLADLEAVEKAIEQRRAVSGIHFCSNHCLLEQNFNPIDSEHLATISTEFRRLAKEYIGAELVGIEQLLRSLGVEVGE